MDYQYYTCDWVVSNVDFGRLIDQARILECQLVLIDLEDEEDINAEGYVFWKFGIRVPSRAILEKFMERVGQEMGFADWRPSSADQYAQGRLFDWDWEDVPPLIMASLNYGVSREALYNEKHRKELENRD